MPPRCDPEVLAEPRASASRLNPNWDALRAFRYAALLLSMGTPSVRAQAPVTASASASAPGAQSVPTQGAGAARALDALAKRKDAGAAGALSDFIRQGQPDAVADRALELLGQLRAPEALPFLGELTHHRRPAARRASYAAIAQLRDPKADPWLGRGLRDSDAGVRGLCARALGERHARTELDVLFRAFERGVPEAGPAIGRLAVASELARLHQALGRAAIQPMLGAYEALLLRADIDVATKLDIIARLGELSTASVKVFFARMMAAQHDWSTQLPVVQALAATAQRIDTRPRPAQGGTP